jgi:hypothetical protein
MSVNSMAGHPIVRALTAALALAVSVVASLVLAAFLHARLGGTSQLTFVLFVVVSGLALCALFWRLGTWQRLAVSVLLLAITAYFLPQDTCTPSSECDQSGAASGGP